MEVDASDARVYSEPRLDDTPFLVPSASMHHHSAVDHDGLTGDEVAVGGRQEDHGADDILGQFVALDGAAVVRASGPEHATASPRNPNQKWHRTWGLDSR